LLWLSYSTKIGDELPFTWKLSIDDGAPHAISSAITGTLKFDSLSAGGHRMLVSDLPKNCTTGKDDREIDVPSGDSVLVSIQVVCTRVTGDVAVTVSTNGPDRDPNGYSLVVDGQPVMALPASTSVTRLVAKLKPGNHIFSLAGVANNCSVTNGAATAFVSAGKSVLALLNVDCVAVSGNLRVTMTTTGSADLVDPSGYVVTVGDIQGALPANGVTLVSVPAGAYTAKLSDIEPNCTASVAEKNVTMAVGATTELAFNVSCAAYPPTTAALVTTDPTVDTLPNQLNSTNRSFDLVGMTTRYASNYMTVTLRFSRPIGLDVIYGYLDFDLDENSTTGVQPFMNLFGGDATQGVEARLSFATGASPFGVVSTLSDNFGVVRTIIDGDSVRFVIPFERIDGDDGNLTITGIVGSTDRPTDLIPNTGVLLSHLPASAVAMKRRAAPSVVIPTGGRDLHLDACSSLALLGMTCSARTWAPPQRPR